MKNSSYKIFGSTLKFGHPYLGHLAAASCLNLITVGADLGFLFLLKKLIDSGFASQNLDMLKWLALGALGILLLRSVFGYAGGYLTAYVDGRMAADIQNRLYDRVQHLSLDFHVENTTGNLMSLLFYHTRGMLGLITSISGTLLRETVRIPALGVFLFSLHSGLALFALIVFPPALAAVRLFKNLITRITQQTHETVSELYTTAEQTLSHMEAVKILARETHETDRFRRLNEKLLSQSIRSYKVAGLSNPVVQLLKMIGITVLVFLGIRAVARNEITVGGLTTFIATAYYFYGSLTGLVSWYLSLPSGLMSAEKVLRVLKAQPSVSPPVNGTVLPNLVDNITVRDVSFRYLSTGCDVLNALSTRIARGETVALAGPSGSGKSTLIKLLLRLYDPSRGSITIDGHDLTEIDFRSLRDLFGLAPQNPGIFQETSLTAIGYGRPGAPLQDVHQAAKLAGAHEFICRLSNGYDTRIGERGVRLSGGEKQRLALARALLRDPEILILDEALSSVDAPTEKAILQRIAEQRRERTTVLVSHRLTSTAHADRIVVIEKGTVIEEGDHKTLMAGPTTYRQWFLSQQAEVVVL